MLVVAGAGEQPPGRLAAYPQAGGRDSGWSFIEGPSGCLLRALVRSSIGAQVRARRRAGRLQAIRTVLEGIGADQAATRHAVAVVSLLASADAGTVLAGQYGLTLDEAGRACARTTRAIIDSLTAQARHAGLPEAFRTAERSTAAPPPPEPS